MLLLSLSLSLLGVVAVPGGTGGFLVGSYLIKRLALTTEHKLRVMFFLSIVALGTMSMFFVQCDTAPLHQAGPAYSRT